MVSPFIRRFLDRMVEHFLYNDDRAEPIYFIYIPFAVLVVVASGIVCKGWNRYCDFVLAAAGAVAGMSAAIITLLVFALICKLLRNYAGEEKIGEERRRRIFDGLHQ